MCLLTTTRGVTRRLNVRVMFAPRTLQLYLVTSLTTLSLHWYNSVLVAEG